MEAVPSSSSSSSTARFSMSQLAPPSEAMSHYLPYRVDTRGPPGLQAEVGCHDFVQMLDPNVSLAGFAAASAADASASASAVVPADTAAAVGASAGRDWPLLASMYETLEGAGIEGGAMIDADTAAQLL